MSPIESQTSLPDLFAAAICDVPHMLLADRKKLVTLLPQIAKAQPEFAVHLSEQLASDKNGDVVCRMVYELDNLLETDPVTAFGIAENIMELGQWTHQGDPIELLAQKLSLLALYDRKKALAMAYRMVETKSPHIHEIIIAEFVPLGVEFKGMGETRNPIFDFAWSILGKSLKTGDDYEGPGPAGAVAVVKAIPKLLAFDVQETLEITEAVFSIKMSRDKQITLFAVLADQLGDLAKFDAVRAFQYYHTIYDYKFPVEKRQPDPVGVLTLPNDDAYASVQNRAVKQLGKMAPFNSDEAFNILENFAYGVGYGWQWDVMYSQMPLMAAIDPMRTLEIVEGASREINRHGMSGGYDWRAFVPVLKTLSCHMKSARLHNLVDQLIANGDDGALSQMTEALKDFRGIPKAVKARWAEALYNSERLDPHYTMDRIKDAVSRVSDEPARQARARMGMALADLKLDF